MKEINISNALTLFLILTSFFSLLAISLIMGIKAFQVKGKYSLVYFIWCFSHLIASSILVFNILIELMGISDRLIIGTRTLISVTSQVLFLFGLLLIVSTRRLVVFALPLLIWLAAFVIAFFSKYVSHSVFSGTIYLVVAYYFNTLRRRTKYFAPTLLTLIYTLMGIHIWDVVILLPILWYRVYGFLLLTVFLLVMVNGFYHITREFSEIDYLKIPDRIFYGVLAIGLAGMAIEIGGTWLFRHQAGPGTVVASLGIVVTGSAIFFLYLARKWRLLHHAE